MVSLGSCQWCHYSYGYDGSGNHLDTLNPYGKDYYMNGRSVAALAAIENLDSDNDGYSNIVEIEADRYPGNPNDDPSKVPAPSRVYSKTQLEVHGPAYPVPADEYRPIRRLLCAIHRRTGLGSSAGCGNSGFSHRNHGVFAGWLFHLLSSRAGSRSRTLSRERGLSPGPVLL